MIKFLCAFLAMLMILCMAVIPAVAAFAETVDVADEPASATEPFSWAYLASIAGATAATVLIVQFLKVPIDKVWKVPTRAFVYVIALLLLLVGTAFTSGLTLDTALLTVVNAFIVALTAYGTYEVTFSKFNK